MLISPLFVKLSIESRAYFTMTYSIEPCTDEELDTMLADRHRKHNTKSIVDKTMKKLRKKVAKECADDKKKKMKDAKNKIDLSGEPHRPPILKTSGPVKEGESKYLGVSTDSNNAWRARLEIGGKRMSIGSS